MDILQPCDTHNKFFESALSFIEFLLGNSDFWVLSVSKLFLDADEMSEEMSDTRTMIPLPTKFPTKPHSPLWVSKRKPMSYLISMVFTQVDSASLIGSYGVVISSQDKIGSSKSVGFNININAGSDPITYQWLWTGG